MRIWSKMVMLACLLTSLNTYGLEAAPVSGIARSFLFNQPIANATITVLETGLKLKTDDQGRFGPIYYPVGKPITLIFEKISYKTTQSATILVPKEGLTSPYNNISFQIPSLPTFYLFAQLVGATLDPNSCHVTSTITDYHKILDDLPQGLAGARAVLTPATQEKPFYFGIFNGGIFKHKTNPFPTQLKDTSLDGGIAYFNLPPRPEPYRLTAFKKGIRFTDSQFLCRKGIFINISPPRGPMALKTA